MEIISLKNIQLNVEANNWQEAIEASGNLLVASQSITHKYVENMIQSVKDLGPYIVIMPHFALAHSAPCEAVKRNDLSIITLKKGVNFGHDFNDPVKVVMSLACTDKESHIEKLSSIAGKLMDDGAINRILNCQTEEELFHYLND